MGLVAAHNEESTISRVVSSLYGSGAVAEVVVVADGASDATADRARSAGAWVWTAPRRMGKGGAVDAALDWIGPADVFLLVDGDVAETAGAAVPLLGPVVEGELDLAIGILPPQSGGGFGIVRDVAAWMIRTRSGFRAQAPLSGQRAVTFQALQACRPLARGFAMETAMTIDAVRLGFRVGEVPVRMAHRPGGRGPRGFAHRGRQGVDIVRSVLPRAAGLR